MGVLLGSRFFFLHPVIETDPFEFVCSLHNFRPLPVSCLYKLDSIAYCTPTYIYEFQVTLEYFLSKIKYSFIKNMKQFQ